jgi:hypothetical protein
MIAFLKINDNHNLRSIYTLTRCERATSRMREREEKRERKGEREREVGLL